MKNRIKKNKIKMFIVVACMFSVSAVFAQRQDCRGPHHRPSVDKIMEKLSASLSLSEAQQKQIAGLYYIHFEALKKRRENLKKELHEQNKQAKAGLEGEVNDLLTETQQQQFAAFLACQRQKQPRHHKNQDMPHTPR